MNCEAYGRMVGNRPGRRAGTGPSLGTLFVLADLFAGRFEKYYSAKDAPPLWLFVHVPKTAGSSLHADISGFLKPSTHIVVHGKSRRISREVLFDAAVQEFLQGHAAQPFRFVSGHLWASNTQTLRDAVPGLRCFTMLRDPLARIISDYRYQRSELNPVHADFIAKNPDFDTFVARPHVHNRTARALLPTALIEAGDIDAAVRFVMNRFDFVGVQERYALSVQALTESMGHQRQPRAQVRVNKETPESRLALTPAQEAQFRRLNTLDYGLVQAFSERWDKIATDLAEFLARRAEPALVRAAAG